MNNEYAKLYPKQAFMLETLIEDCRNCGLAIKSVSLQLGFATVIDEHGNTESLKFNSVDNTWL